MADEWDQSPSRLDSNDNFDNPLAAGGNPQQPASSKVRQLSKYASTDSDTGPSDELLEQQEGGETLPLPASTRCSWLKHCLSLAFPLSLAPRLKPSSRWSTVDHGHGGPYSHARAGRMPRG